MPEALHNKSSQIRKSYPIPYKLMIIEESKLMSRTELCLKHSLSESMVRKWRKDEVKLRNAFMQGSQKLRIHSKDPLKN